MHVAFPSRYDRKSRIGSGLPTTITADDERLGIGGPPTKRSGIAIEEFNGNRSSLPTKICIHF